VPQEPFDPLQIFEHTRAQLILICAFADRLRQSLGSLIQYRQSHRQMKPVQQVFSLGIQIQLHVAYVLAAVGEEIDLLVRLHALGLKQLEQTPPWAFYRRSEPRQSTFPTSPVFPLGPA